MRFGAFHIFVPTILKPAPTSLRLLLWALHDADKRGLDASALPAAMPQQGLTSVPFDRSTPRGFYQVVGFRVCGERAVRVDMLERLGDMIRTRVFWRAQREGEERPDGSVEGGGFTVVPDMMSLVGCSGDEFSSILKSLGFSAQKRKAPAKPELENTAADAPADALAKPDIEAGAETAAAATPEADKAVEAGPADAAPAAAETEPADASPAEAADATPTSDAAPAEAAAEDAKPAEPEMIEVWWPKDTGPFRHQRQHAGSRSKSAKGSSGKPDRNRHKKAGGGKKPSGQRSAAPRREKPMDPNSPFAVLGQLKQGLTKK